MDKVYLKKTCSCGNYICVDSAVTAQNSSGYWHNCEKCDSTLFFTYFDYTQEKNLQAKLREQKNRQDHNDRVKSSYKLVN